MASRLDEILAAAFPTAGDASARPNDATARVLSNVGAHADSREGDAQSRIDRQLIELLARGVFQFAPDSSQDAEESGCARSQRLLSDLDVARVRARSVAIDFEDAGDSVTAAAILDAIKLKRERGRPPEWQPYDVLILWMEVMDIARRNVELRGRSIFTILRNKPEWQSCSFDELRSKFRDGARKIGMNQTQAIAALRALGD